MAIQIKQEDVTCRNVAHENETKTLLCLVVTVGDDR